MKTRQITLFTRFLSLDCQCLEIFLILYPDGSKKTLSPSRGALEPIDRSMFWHPGNAGRDPVK